MGTNYYYVRECKTCKQDIKLHIGKSSAGWVFQLHVENDGLVPRDLDDWFELIYSTPFGYIKTEYGDIISPVEIAEVILRRRGPGHSTEWLRANGAVQGPDGLARRENNGRIVGGPTWDEVTGEFS